MNMLQQKRHILISLLVRSFWYFLFEIIPFIAISQSFCWLRPWAPRVVAHRLFQLQPTFQTPSVSSTSPAAAVPAWQVNQSPLIDCQIVAWNFTPGSDKSGDCTAPLKACQVDWPLSL